MVYGYASYSQNTKQKVKDVNHSEDCRNECAADI